MIEVDQPVSDFIEKYLPKFIFRADIKRRHIWGYFGKRSPEIRKLGKIDIKDIIPTENNNESKVHKCPYCPKEFDIPENHAMHIVLNHPG
jgi:hypothetical protein